jgi:hypothetical protein
MKNKNKLIFTFFAIFIAFASCKKSEEEANPVQTNNNNNPTQCVPDTVFNAGTGTGPRLIFKFKFDSTQVRLNNIGQPSSVASGNAAQSPKFKLMSQHYIELANTLTPLGGGAVLYHATETTAGGSTAIDYCASIQSKEGSAFFSIPLSSITPGSYEWLRVSLAAQFYDITYKSTLIPGNHLGTGTVASFIGYKTYLKGYQINGHNYIPSGTAGGVGNHLQGYWGFETSPLGITSWFDGQAPAGATTVPNPIFASSPIPPGSCVVTGQFVNLANAQSPLVITGSETQDIVITVSLSTNKSFEWHEVNADGLYEPTAGEYVVDMGIRGLKPIKN